MIYYLLSCVYFFGPAYLANSAPPLAYRFNIFKSLGKPIDGGRMINNKPILGDHKTWRGLVSEIIVCTILMPIFIKLHEFLGLEHYQAIGFNAFDQINGFLLGFLLSLGIIFGDLFFAFIKRRLNLKPGAKFIPFDQINYIIGAFIFSQPFLQFELKFWFSLIILTFFLHVFFNRTGYNLGLHNAKW
ncbi:MAG: CDP-2,3-bis-(O-geranylgeranyl)-sn-glycerol synthase [Candidatus Microsyncoccus archaeolyticus]|nr:MAG: CDP-2,3-bis-(O-geranylgeranyl)-sn-glycerol synthase [Candidatus Parcubacteria bacterium]